MRAEPDLPDRLARLRERIRRACRAAGRDAESVRLLAVSKGVPAAVLRQAVAMGQREFGESYLQEALPKIDALADLAPVWHFIGPVQSNKTRDIAARFDRVHGVERLKIAQRLSEQRPAHLPPLEVCVQVNISGQASKSGCPPAEAPALCRAVAALPRLRLCGLMALPAPSCESRNPREPFAALRRLAESVRAILPDEAAAHFDTLSAGMSDDLEAAIAEGSTCVRVGSALFGERDP